jgi:Dyp-type peroxidase family
MTYPTPTPTPPPSPAAPPIRPAPTYPQLRTNANIQGNVLAPFSKDYQQFAFLQFLDQGHAQAFLLQLLPLVSTNDEVTAFNQAFSAARGVAHEDPDDLSATWLSVSLTAHGLGVLCPAATKVLQESIWDSSSVGRFLRGAASSPDVASTGPEAPANWLFGRSDQVIDAVVTIAADTAQGLIGLEQEVRQIAAIHDVVSVFEQEGRVLPGARHGHEHFGFKDGISQPGVMGYDKPDPTNQDQVTSKPGTLLTEAGEFVLGFPGHDNPGRAVPSWMFDGSFLVIRRLAQDVPGWWAQAEQLSGKLGTSGDGVGAKLIGRWRSGVPTAVDPTNDPRSGPDLSSDNNFDYSNDLQGASTPLCAHIRKVNPRSGTVPGEDEVSKHRILRRGVPYGAPFDPAAGEDHGPDASRGLIFACYQASIGEQFEFLQQTWADNPNFSQTSTGPDPTIGPAGSAAIPAASGNQSVSLSRFVKLEGALYAFTPSMQTLQLLADGSTLPSPTS